MARCVRSVWRAAPPPLPRLRLPRLRLPHLRLPHLRLPRPRLPRPRLPCGPVTSSVDIICGVHKLRTHRVRRSVEAMATPDGEDGAIASDEPTGPSADAAADLNALLNEIGGSRGGGRGGDGGGVGLGGDGGGVTPTGATVPASEARTLDGELMNQLRVVKIQELLAGAAGSAADGPSDDSDGGGNCYGGDLLHAIRHIM